MRVLSSGGEPREGGGRNGVIRPSNDGPKFRGGVFVQGENGAASD